MSYKYPRHNSEYIAQVLCDDGSQVDVCFYARRGDDLVASAISEAVEQQLRPASVEVIEEQV